MVEYIIKAPPLERLSTVVAEALAEGVTQQELMGVVLTTVATYTPPMQVSLDDEADCEDFQAPAPDTIYTELPPGFLDLPSAARKYGLNEWTLRNWVRKGHVKMQGRIKGSAKGGGFILVRDSELRLYIDTPKSKGGRPRKTQQIC